MIVYAIFAILTLAGLVFWLGRRGSMRDAEERLEMHRDATEAERRAAGMSDHEVR